MKRFVNPRKFVSFSLPLLLMILASYFIYHTIYGDKGFFTLAKLNNELEQKKEKLELIVKEREKIQNKVASFNDKNMDLDLLDQQARKILNYADPEESILIIKRAKK